MGKIQAVSRQQRKYFDARTFINEQWCCATILNGFILWNITGDTVQKLVLPNSVRNITKKLNTSSNIILSKGDKLSVTKCEMSFSRFVHLSVLSRSRSLLCFHDYNSFVKTRVYIKEPKFMFIIMLYDDCDYCLTHHNLIDKVK